VYVSAASIWELEIKRALGRLHAPEDLTARVEDSIHRASRRPQA
jgi:PIN domain nuclease of toxin-antitoxin system